MKIAITGVMCCGKTTIANYLVQKYNYKKFSFADDLKKFAVDIFDMRVKDRKLLQEFGTKMKEIDKTIWIRRLDNKIKDIAHNIVIDDLRFKDEEKYLRLNGFKILKLDIDNNLQNNRLKNTYCNDFNMHLECKNHESEINTNQINYDYYYLINNESESNIIKYIDNLIFINDIKFE
jgi:broad-specificity NMP kinase